MKLDLAAARDATVPDVLPAAGEPFHVLFCGINPGLYSAATGWHFARPGNRFWPALHQSGFTPRQLKPSEQAELTRYGLGITNIAPRATAQAAELTPAELRDGAARLLALIDARRPRVIAIAGVTAYRTAFALPRAVIGPQPEPLGAARLWILPNPSGLNASWPAPRIAEAFRELKEAVGERLQTLAHHESGASGNTGAMHHRMPAVAWARHNAVSASCSGAGSFNRKQQLHQMDTTGGTGRLQGKHVLVTGGTTGIGFAIAERFLREGARVVVTGRNEELGLRAEAALRDAGQSWFVAADAGDPAAVARSVDLAAGHLGTLDVLVNNAGVGVEAGLLRTPLADYDRLMDVNVRGYLLYAQAAYPYLSRRRGCMIHIASDAGIWGEQAIGLYSVSKAAVVMLGKMLALEGGPDGVRSNVLCPGDTWPGMRHMAPAGEEDRPESGDWPIPPIGRIGEARDVAAAAVFYASDEAEFITGTTLLVDGGMTAGYHQRDNSPLAEPGP